MIYSNWLANPLSMEFLKLENSQFINNLLGWTRYKKCSAWMEKSYVIKLCDVIA